MSEEDSSEELVDGPRSCEVVQWGGAPGQHTRHKYQLSAFFNAEDHRQGMIWNVNRRPRHRDPEEQGPFVVRVVQPNPNGMIWHLMQKRKVVMRTIEQDKERMIDSILEIEESENGPGNPPRPHPTPPSAPPPSATRRRQ